MFPYIGVARKLCRLQAHSSVFGQSFWNNGNAFWCAHTSGKLIFWLKMLDAAWKFSRTFKQCQITQCISHIEWLESDLSSLRLSWALSSGIRHFQSKMSFPDVWYIQCINNMKRREQRRRGKRSNLEDNVTTSATQPELDNGRLDLTFFASISIGRSWCALTPRIWGPYLGCWTEICMMCDVT